MMQTINSWGLEGVNTVVPKTLINHAPHYSMLAHGSLTSPSKLLQYSFLLLLSPSMEFHPFPIIILVSLAVVVADATVPSVVYWQKVLPKTAMPQALRHLLPEEDVSLGDEAVDVGVGGGGVSVGAGHGGSNHQYWWHHPHHPYHPRDGPFIYRYAASKDQLRDDPNVALFFLEKDLHPSKKMNLHFTRTTSGAKLLPRKVAETIPFSSNEFSDILNRFSVEPGSAEALEMKKTIEECEVPAMEGEDKYCATSLEAMVDYSTSRLGKNVKVLATEVGKEESRQQEFTISSGVIRMVGDERVVCHGQNYPYVVFYCHASHTTKAYLVPMVGADGTKVKAVAVCHTDTSKWNPKHLAFQVLKVKPGTVPICHFLPEGHIVWTSK